MLGIKSNTHTQAASQQASGKNRSPRIVVFAAQKGGSGKTTLAGHFAVEAERQGLGPVAVLDTDPQGSLSRWLECRTGGTPVLLENDGGPVGLILAQAKEAGFRLIVLDTPPAVTRAISDMVALGDLVVVPTRPSPHDLRAVGATVDIAEWHEKPLVFVVNGATARARITADAAVALSQHGTVAPVTVHHRVDFAASMIDGGTVMEKKPDGRSAQEISELCGYLSERLAKLEPAPSELTPAASSSITSLNALGRQGAVFGRRLS